ncbi:amidase [Sparassis latifolia]
MWPFSSSYSTGNISLFKQAQRDERLSSVSMAVATSVNTSAILSAGASEIVKHIEIGEWTASQVLEAYIQRAAFAHQSTNCLTEVMFADAREEARALDNEFEITKTVKGPLHGVPISFKDTCGIPFVKTNVCQTMMTFECANPIWGVTVHPQNKRYTSGGSSGGEAALIAMGGSPLGFGNDIGGSLRIPAAYCGIHSLRPGTWRISGVGMTSALEGFEGIPTVMGPMCRSVDDVELACRVVFGKGSNREVSPMPFRDVQIPAKLHFGYYISDGFIKASPACQRAVRETVEALMHQGHECIPIVVPEPLTHVELFAGLTSADGYKTLLAGVGRDPTDPGLFLTTLGPRLFGWFRSLAVWIISTFFGDDIFARCMRMSRTRSVAEYWQLVAKRDVYKQLFYDEVWEKHQLDGIIAPVQALPQAQHGTCAKASVLAAGTFLYNLLNLPVGVVPVSRVDPKRDQVTEEWSNPRIGEGHGSPLFERLLYGRGGLYDPVDMAGMPTAVQVIGRQWEDEKVVGMMRVVDRALGPRWLLHSEVKDSVNLRDSR